MVKIQPCSVNSNGSGIFLQIAVLNEIPLPGAYSDVREEEEFYLGSNMRKNNLPLSGGDKRKAQFRYKYNNHHNNGKQYEERNRMPGYRKYRDTGDRSCDKQAHAHRRRYKSNCRGEYHDYAEMDWVKAHTQGDREENRSRYQYYREGFHEQTEDYKKHQYNHNEGKV